jgi:hypothetical protein
LSGLEKRLPIRHEADDPLRVERSFPCRQLGQPPIKLRQMHMIRRPGGLVQVVILIE